MYEYRHLEEFHLVRYVARLHDKILRNQTISIHFLVEGRSVINVAQGILIVAHHEYDQPKTIR